MSNGQPLVEMLMYYHQNSGFMPEFRSDPEDAMERFGLEEADRHAIRSALEGDFNALDTRLRDLLPFDDFPTQLPGWDRALLMW